MKRIALYISFLLLPFVAMAQATYVPTGDTAFISGSVTITFPAERGTTRLSHPFSINSGGGKVCFAHGNLQYQASTGTWRFAEHQYDIVGNNPGNSVLTDAARQTQSDWIETDLRCSIHWDHLREATTGNRSRGP